jgi:hypothetical protein
LGPEALQARPAHLGITRWKEKPEISGGREAQTGARQGKRVHFPNRVKGARRKWSGAESGSEVIEICHNFQEALN